LLEKDHAMFRSAVVALLFLILPTLAPAQETEQSQQATHEVVRGESLWTLAERYYGNPYRWPVIYQANRSAIPNPNVLEPGQVLVIPEVGEARVETPDPQGPVSDVQVQQVFVVAGGDTVAVVDTAIAADSALAAPAEGTWVQAPQAEGPCPGPGQRTLFFPGAEGGSRCVVETPPGLGRTPFYPRAPADSREAGVVVVSGEGEYQGAGDAFTIDAVPFGHVYGAEWLDLPGTETPSFGTITGFAYLHNVRSEEGPVRVGERVIITLDGDRAFRVGDLLQSYQAGRADRRMGRVLEPTGILVVTEAGYGQVEATVSSELGRIWVGDWVRPAPEHQHSPGMYPTPVESDLTATVLGFPDDRPIQGFGARVFLDLGTADGVGVGDVFMATVDEPGPLQGLEAARIQVVLADEDRSTGRVVSLKYPGLATGDIVRLIAKMN
jgi:LysM repeat protein